MQRKYLLELYKQKNTIFNLKDISLIWKETDIDILKSRVNYYVKNKQLYSVKKGIYAKSKDYNEFELATKIYKPSYISLETVLQLEGIVFQNHLSIDVVSYLSREIKCDKKKIIYKKIKNGILMNPKGLLKKENYYIASKERAVLDTLYLYKDYYFDNLRKFDWDKCFELLAIYENKKLKQRLERHYKNAK